MFFFADQFGEALAGIQRPGTASANYGADQLAVVEAAVAQLPPEYRLGQHAGDPSDRVVHRVVVRADTAGYVAAFAAGLVARTSSSPSAPG